MDKRYEEANKITNIGIIINIILSIAKILAGVIGKSSAIIADGIHSISDVFSSIGVLIGIVISKKPNDDGHNYGHEKAETLAGFCLAITLIVIAFKIGYEGILSLINLNEIQTPSILPLIVAFLSILVKEYQYRITIKVGKSINSKALIADAWHHRSDALSSIAAFLGILGARFGYKILDPVASLIVCICVFKVGIDVLKDTSNELLDASIEKEKESVLIDIVKNTDGVDYISSLKTRKHGPTIYVDIAVAVDPELTVEKGHDIATFVENNIKSNIEHVKKVYVHIDPSIKIHPEDNKYI